MRDKKFDFRPRQCMSLSYPRIKRERLRNCIKRPECMCMDNECNSYVIAYNFMQLNGIELWKVKVVLKLYRGQLSPTS